MPTVVIKTFDELVQDMTEWIIAHSDQITDLTPGSVIRSFCEATGLCLEEIYTSFYLGIKRTLDTIQEDIYNFPQKEGTKSSTNVVFSRTGSSGTINIPIGTTVGTQSGLNFITTFAGSIDDGETESSPIPVEAVEVGSAFNVSANSITLLVDTIDGVEEVTNATAATGGTDEESLFLYKQRFQNYIEGLGKSNLSGLIAGALSVDGITSASVVELFPPVNNVNAYLYVDDGSALGPDDDMVEYVQSIIDGDGTEENPGYRAVGVNVIVDAPTIVTKNVVLTVILDDEVTVSTTQIETDVNTVLSEYMNTLPIGQKLIHAEMISRVMSVYGISDCVITQPSGNVNVSNSQVIRLGTVTINIG